MADAKSDKDVYVLVSGEHFYRDAESGEMKTYPLGTEVRLNASQAEAFKDKFKPKVVYAAEQEAVKVAKEEAAKVVYAKAAAAEEAAKAAASKQPGANPQTPNPATGAQTGTGAGGQS